MSPQPQPHLATGRLWSFLASHVLSGWSSLRRLLGVVAADRRSSTCVLALLSLDLLWIAYFGVVRSTYELSGDDSLYRHKALLITAEGGIPEWFNYAEALLVVFLLARMGRLTRQPIYSSLALAFFVGALDDALQIHEVVGRRLVDWLDIPRDVIGLRASDVGEVITWSALGAIVGPIIAVSLARSRPPHRENGLAILLAFGLLVFFAVVVDQLYSNFHELFALAGMLIDLVEDGGEMVAVTLACALVLGAGREHELSTDQSGSR